MNFLNNTNFFVFYYFFSLVIIYSGHSRCLCIIILYNSLFKSKLYLVNISHRILSHSAVFCNLSDDQSIRVIQYKLMLAAPQSMKFHSFQFSILTRGISLRSFFFFIFLFSLIIVCWILTNPAVSEGITGTVIVWSGGITLITIGFDVEVVFPWSGWDISSGFTTSERRYI